MAQDIFGYEEDCIAIFNLKFTLNATNKAGKAISREPMYVKVKTECGKLKNSYIFDEIDINKDRVIMFRAPMPAKQDMKMDIYLSTKNEENIDYYKLSSFKYSLIYGQKGGLLYKNTPDDAESNRKVTVDDLGHRKGFKYLDNFNIGFNLKLDQFIPTNISKIKGLNERDEINRNSIQT